jgi:drug/metabolite transporter (DMT)-like permease
MTPRDQWLGYTFALCAGACYGLNNVLVRQGLVGFKYPLLGATIALTMGTIILLLISTPYLRRARATSGSSLLYLVLAGVTSALGVACSYIALSLAPVVVVSPVTATFPLFTLVTSRLLLGQAERITWRVVLGALLVVGGVAVITVSRAVS